MSTLLASLLYDSKSEPFKRLSTYRGPPASFVDCAVSMNDNWVLAPTGSAVHSFNISADNELVYDNALPIEGSIYSVSLGASARAAETLAIGYAASPYALLLTFNNGTFNSTGQPAPLPTNPVFKVRVAKLSPVVAAVTAINQPPGAATQFVWQDGGTSWTARTVPIISAGQYYDHTDVAINGNGNAVAVPYYFNNGSNYGYRIYRLSGSAYELNTTITTPSPQSCAFDPNGQFFITGRTDSPINAELYRFTGISYSKIGDIDTGVTTPTTVRSVAFSPTGDYFVIAMPNKVIFYSFDPLTAEYKEVFSDDTVSNVVSVSIGGQGTKIAVACNQNSNALILYGKL